MAITAPPEITPYPEAPQRGGMSEAVFVPTANTFVSSLEPRRVEMQALADWMKTAGDYVDTTITDNKTAIDTVHASIADVNTVADDIANVNTTAANISDVNTTATNIADVNKVAAIDGDVSTVAASDLALNTVAADIASVNTTAGSIANVNAVATDIVNVNTTATNIADVNAVANDILAVQAAAALSKRQSLYARSLAFNPPLANETLRLDYANRAYGIGDKATGLIDDIQPFGGAHTFTRATPKWVFDATGTLVEVPANEPAYQHDPVTGEALGLLKEEQRTNLLLRSEELNNAVWSKTGITVTPDQDSSPFVLADRVQSTSSTAVMYQAVSVTPGESYVFSFYAKNGTGSRSDYRVRDATNGPDIIPSNTSYFSEINNQSYSRVSVSVTAPAGCTQIWFYPLSGSSVGAGGYDLYITALMVEPGSAASSYIPTEGSQVTRAADVVSRTLGTEYNAAEGGLSVTATIPTGETVIALGSESIVSDSNTEKTHTLSYSADPSATTLDIAPGASVATIKRIEYITRA